MKLLHTSDWHIGQTFFGYDRKEEHLQFFNWLKTTINELSIDVLLIAGDIFDSPNPSAESQRVFYRFLKEITSENPALQIVIIAGNHDSAARLEAPNPLLEEMNIIIRGTVKRDNEGKIDFNHLIVPLVKAGNIEGYCFAIPYLRHGDYPDSENYAQGVKALIDSIYHEVKDNKPIIVMAHLHATGAEISDNDFSERTIIGGIECISPDTFDKPNIIYTALGHLHKAQKVQKENIRYAGSPIPMSFAEINYKQGVWMLEISNQKLEKFERIHFDAPVKLVSIPKEPKELSDVLKEINNLSDGAINSVSPFIEIKVLLKEPEPSLRYKLEEALIGKSIRLASLKAFYTKTENRKELSYEELKTINPIEMAEDIFVRQYGEAMPDKMKNLLSDLMKNLEL